MFHSLLSMFCICYILLIYGCRGSSLVKYFFYNLLKHCSLAGCVRARACVCVCVSRSVVFDSCNPMGSSPPGSSVCGILQARILEWVASSFSILAGESAIFLLKYHYNKYVLIYTYICTHNHFYPFWIILLRRIITKLKGVICFVFFDTYSHVA